MKRISNFVSVIIPCYNDGRFILRAIESVLNQTYQEFEIIIVNDGSTDLHTIRTLDTIKSPKATVYHKKNAGVSSARNYGIEQSRGEYILTLDADDRYAPEFLEKGVEILKENKSVGMVTSNLIRIYKDYQKKAEKAGGDVSAFAKGNQANASLLFRFQCWKDAGGYDENIPGFEDWDFAIGVTKCGWLVHSIDEYLFYYRNTEFTQYNRDLTKRPEIVKYLTCKHSEVFIENIGDIVYQRELKIQELNKMVDVFKNSYSLRIGNAIIHPLRIAKNLILGLGARFKSQVMQSQKLT